MRATENAAGSFGPARPAPAGVVQFLDRAHGGRELGALNRIQKRWSGKDVQVLAVSGDRGDLGALSTWIEGQKLVFPVLRDNHGIVMSRYGITDLPMTVIVDGDGSIFAIGQPPAGELESAIEAELSPLTRK